MGLGGIVRATASTPEHREGFNDWVSYSSTDEDEYGANIQIAELNALNAALAVIWWKKWCGFYVHPDGELHMTFTLSGNVIANNGTNT